jgi:hypothetical protein
LPRRRPGQCLGRCDNDGDLDYFVAFRGRPNRFYRNDKGTFRDVASEVGLADNARDARRGVG